MGRNWGCKGYTFGFKSERLRGFHLEVRRQGFGFRVSGSGFRVAGLGFRGFRLQVSGFGVTRKPRCRRGSCSLSIAEEPAIGKVDIRLPGKENSNSHGARPVHQIISIILWFRTSRLPIKNSLSLPIAGEPAIGMRGSGSYLTRCIYQLSLESQLPHKIVNLISNPAIVNDELTVLWGS